jgi:D-glycero-D-manno-heptose 1,7-bisphosphate phosphatase
LKSTGYSIVVVTNQPDVGNRIVEKKNIEEMHNYLMSVLQLDLIKVCYHAQTDDCKCRKPKPGMLLDAANEMNIDLKSSYMVGDRKSDIEAGQAVGCYSIFIDNDYSDDEKPQAPDYSVKTLIEAAQHIYSLSQQQF